MVYTPSTLLLNFVIALLAGFFCASLARSRGRNPYFWFTAGLLFPLLGWFLLYFAPDKRKEKPTAQARLLTLREKAAAKLAAKEAALEAKTGIYPTYPFSTEFLWYYLDKEGIAHGPMSAHAIGKALEHGDLHLDSFIWRKEWSDWQRVSSLLTPSPSN